MKFLHPMQPALPASDLATSSILEAPPAASHRCPLCRRAVQEEAETCSQCGAALTEDEETQNKSMWVLIIVGLISALTFSFSVIR